MFITLNEEDIMRLSPTEVSIIDWINEHETEVPNRSITEIADATFTSAPTVSRTIRKCGYMGIGELKYKILAKSNYCANEHTVNKIFKSTLEECQRTIEALDVDIILQIIHDIRFARRIYILARGTTALIARDFEFQLQLLGHSVSLISDAQIMRIADRIFKKNELVFIFTVKNSTPELEIAACHAREKGAKIILCCCIQGTCLEKYADLSVLGGTKKNRAMIADFNIVSRIPLYIISKTLIDYLVL